MQRTFVRIVWCTLLLFPSLLSLHAEDFWQDTLWIRKIPLGGHSYAKILFHPDGKSLFAASDQYLFRYDVQTGVVRDMKEMRSKGNVRDYILMNDNRTMIIACDSQHKVSYDYTRYIEIWDIDTGYIRHHKYEQFFETQRTSAVRLSHDEKTIYVGSDVTGGELYEIEFLTGKLLNKRKDVGHYIDISSDGRTMVSSYIGDDKGICKLIDIAKWETLALLSRVYEPKFSPDGRFFAGRNELENILLYDIENKIGYILKGHSGRISDICFTNDSKYLVSSADDGGGGAKGGYFIWDIINRKKIYEAPYFTGTTGVLTLSPDDQLYAVLNGAYQVKLWRFRNPAVSSLSNVTEIVELRIIPNPTQSSIELTIPPNCHNGVLSITDIQGKEILRQNLVTDTQQEQKRIIDISSYHNGHYYLRIETSSHTYSSSFIINR